MRIDNNLRRCAGTAVPLFSLRSEISCGIGDFGDLLLFIDWLQQTHQRIAQLLPLNDTTATRTWLDSYPYNIVSVYALHPIYICLHWLGALTDPAQATAFEEKRKALNALESVDYEATLALKESYCRLFFAQEGQQWLKSDAFATFFADNARWLRPYAVWSYLRDTHQSADCAQWRDYTVFNEAHLSALCSNDSPAHPHIAFTFFMQFALHSQLKRVADYARSNGIFLKGDLPIGVNRHSVEVWTLPQLFHTDEQAGAPPDDFSASGQNWTFPTYNWPNMETDGFAWWKQRLAKMNAFFDAFRIDHILGFFRIWEIPADQQQSCSGHFNPALPLSHEDIANAGISFSNDLFLHDPYRPNRFHPRIDAKRSDAYRCRNDNERDAFDRLYSDFFYHRHNDLWKEQALKRLAPLVDATPMLPCGEDLGMIPAAVPDVLQQLRILSLEVERMPKTSAAEFTDLARLPRLSVCASSTHDMPPLRLWWLTEDHARRQRYYNDVLQLPDEAPDNCSPDLVQRILARLLAAPSLLAIFPLQDWLALSPKTTRNDPQAEQINIPSIWPHYWRYRIHLPLEALLQADPCNRRIASLIEQSDRT